MHETSISGEPVVPGHLGLAVRAVVFGTLMGAGSVAVAMWAARTMLPPGAAPAGANPADSPVFPVVVGGTFGGLALAVIVAWSLMRPLRSAYRRGGLAVLAGFATFVAMLPTVYIDQTLGRWGLLGYALVCVLGCALLARRVVTGWRGV
jgi:hypothetical protein